VIHQEELTIETRGRGTYELTRELQRVVAGSGIAKGLATIFVHHTSASLIINENADPEVRRDLDAFLDGWSRMEIGSSSTSRKQEEKLIADDASRPTGRRAASDSERRLVGGGPIGASRPVGEGLATDPQGKPTTCPRT
jgi:hypothetical protein